MAIKASKQAKIDEAAAQSLRALRVQLAASSQTYAEDEIVKSAEAIALSVMRAYWKAVAPTGYPLVQPPGRTTAPPGDMDEISTAFGEAVAQLPVEDAAYHISQLYSAMLPPSLRSARGIFYTPPTLAGRLINLSDAAEVNWKTATVLDPAAGAGAFLVPAARLMLKSLGTCTPAIVLRNLESRLRGHEIDAFAAWMGQVFIEAVALPWIKSARRRLGPIYRVTDSLRDGDASTFDLVIGNPPFGRVSLDVALRARFARSLYGHANLYGVFLDLAIQKTKPNGVIAFLTPSSFLAGHYFKNLRGLLGTEAPPLTVDFVEGRKDVFEDVLQETVLATYRKGGKRSLVSVNFLSVKSQGEAKATKAGKFDLPSSGTAPWILPRHAEDETFATRLRQMPCRLSDWGYQVSTGPLVWNRFKKQLCSKLDQGALPLIWAECVSWDGTFEFRARRRNHEPYFIPNAGDDWLIVRKGCVLLQRTTAKEQARRLIAAEMPHEFVKASGGVVVENHLNMMVPLSGAPMIKPGLLTLVLNSDLVDRAFRCLSGSVAVSAYELEEMPLPDPKAFIEQIGSRVNVKSVDRAIAHFFGST